MTIISLSLLSPTGCEFAPMVLSRPTISSTKSRPTLFIIDTRSIQRVHGFQSIQCHAAALYAQVAVVGHTTRLKQQQGNIHIRHRN